MLSTPKSPPTQPPSTDTRPPPNRHRPIPSLRLPPPSPLFTRLKFPRIITSSVPLSSISTFTRRLRSRSLCPSLQHCFPGRRIEEGLWDHYERELGASGVLICFGFFFFISCVLVALLHPRFCGDGARVEDFGYWFMGGSGVCVRREEGTLLWDYERARGGHFEL